MPSDKYVVIVSGQRFTFTRDQLESEPDNYFTTYFLGDFNEATNSINELELETEPLLFELIQAHLRGYTIFPIQEGCIPKYMSKMGMLKSLRKEADYFGLASLVGSIDEELVSAAEHPMNEGGGQRIYQVSTHKSGEDGDPKRVAALSLEGATTLINDPSLVLPDVYNCEKCMDISQGWEVTAWRQTVPKVSTGPIRFVTSPTHFLVESKLV